MSFVSPEQPVIKEILHESGATVDVLDIEGDVSAIDALTLELEPLTEIDKIAARIDAEERDYLSRMEAYEKAVISYDDAVELARQNGTYTYDQAAHILADQKSIYPPVEPEKPASMR